MTLFLICFCLIFIAFSGLFIKGILTKDKTLAKTCASSINESEPCEICGSTQKGNCAE